MKSTTSPKVRFRSFPLARVGLRHALLGVGVALGLVACTQDETDSQGGTSSETPDEPITFDEKITWHEHVAPLVTGKCSGCHSEGGIGPFSVTTYKESKKWAPLMERDILSGAMPPWGAQETDECTPPGTFKDDLRLSDYEKALFSQWIKDGLLEGDPKDAVELPTPPALSLQDPNVQLTIPSSATVEGNTDAFICFSLDPKITEPVWLTGSQVEAGNPAIVHHALVFLDRSGDAAEMAGDSGQYPCFGSPGTDDPTLLSAWAPGSVPSLLPADTGTPLLPGDKLVVQVHYHPTGMGEEVDDSTRIDLKWTTTEPSYLANIFLIGNSDVVDDEFFGGKGYGLTTGPDFMIPADSKDHQEINRFWYDDGGDPLNRLLPVSLWMVGTHMHYVGTDMKITVENEKDGESCLVQTPEWDFNWQRGYFFEGAVEDLPAIHLGDTLTMRCTYNNNMENPFVREALEAQGFEETKDVQLGEETLDEMCIGIFGLAVPAQYKEAIGL